MSHEFCIVLTTTNSKENKQQLIDHLLLKQLVACVQTMPIESHYIWQGEVCVDEEILIIMKTHKLHYVEVEKAIEQIHDYEVPQIVQVPIVDGFNPYLEWIKSVTNL